MTRAVTHVGAAVARTEADGLQVFRALPQAGHAHANPFLLVEELGPADLDADVVAPRRAARGFEEVTWVLSGTVEHVRRARGADVPTVVAAGRAEWLTSGRGDAYVERVRASLGVRVLRVWIALPRKDRRVERSMVVGAAATDALQAWTAAGAYAGRLEVDLLAGRLLGARAPVLPWSRVTVARVRMPADTTFVYAVDSLEPGVAPATVLLYVLAGRAEVGPADRLVSARELAILGPPPAPPQPSINWDEVRIRTRPGETVEVLWLSGIPVGAGAAEPFVRQGGAVLRTEEEMLQALEDYRSGRFGDAS